MSAPAQFSSDTRTLGYAQRLATAIWEKYWKQDAPEWKPEDDVVWVLTQIDNMTAGLVRPGVAQQPSDAVRMYADALDAANKRIAELEAREWVIRDPRSDDNGPTHPRCPRCGMDMRDAHACPTCNPVTRHNGGET